MAGHESYINGQIPNHSHKHGLISNSCMVRSEVYKKMSEYITVKDIIKIKKALDNAGAIPLKPDDIIELPIETWKTMMKMEKWADKVLREAEAIRN